MVSSNLSLLFNPLLPHFLLLFATMHVLQIFIIMIYYLFVCGCYTRLCAYFGFVYVVLMVTLPKIFLPSKCVLIVGLKTIVFSQLSGTFIAYLHNKFMYQGIIIEY